MGGTPRATRGVGTSTAAVRRAGSNEIAALATRVVSGRSGEPRAEKVSAPMLVRMAPQACRTCAVLLCLMVLQGGRLGAAQEPVGDFQLSWMRQYGRSTFSDCRLDVVMVQERAIASLHCSYSGVDGKGRRIPPLRSREELSTEESRRLADLVRASALYEGGHVGKDDTPVDGAFKVLKLRSGGPAVMVVTSGNPTFEQDKARRTLLSSLRAVEKRLADAGSKCG